MYLFLFIILLLLLNFLLQLAPQLIVGLGLLHQQPPSLTKLVQASHINVIYQFIISQRDQIGYPRPRCRFLNWYVLCDEVTPYQEDQAFFCSGPTPLAPVVPTTAAGLQRRFLSAPSILFPRYLAPIQTVSGVHPISYPMGTGGPFPGGKAAGAWSWPLTSN
jgi:hypothetical protein